MGADYSRVTHPCAALLRAEAPFTLDLHVLGLPPAFVLSQDQTLQFDLFSIWRRPNRTSLLSFSFDALASSRYLLGRSSLFRLALLLISLFSSVFNSVVEMIHPNRRGRLIRVSGIIVKLFFYFFYRGRPLRVHPQLWL